MKTITEYVVFGENTRVITKEEAFSNKTENIGYLDGVRADFDYSSGKRAGDKDIIEKGFFVIDIDMRKNCENKDKDGKIRGYEVSNDDIITVGKHIASFSEKDAGDLGEWSKIVFSGGGLHVYFSGNPRYFDNETYSLGVGYIYKKWNEYWGADEYKTDDACRNLARVLRLPGSINQRNGAKVIVLAERKKESKLFNQIENFAEIEKQRLEQEKLERQKQLEKELKKFEGTDNEFYLKINSIPAYQIAELLIPEFPFNGKKNFKNKKRGFTGYWYCKDTNTIVNGGSRYFDWGNTNSCWNNFSLIKHFKGYTNKQVFTFFKNILGK